MITFTYTGKIRPLPRPRFSRSGGVTRSYTPRWAQELKKSIADAYVGQGGTVFGGAVSVRIDVYRKMPDNRPKRIQRELDTYRPDIDNIAKLFLDALIGHAYEDDSQVVKLEVIKHDRARADEDLTIITLKEVRTI